jgi:aminoglycoside 3-N-acetyltransferase
VVKENSFVILGDEGRVWMTVNDVAVSDEGFEELGAEFEREGSVKREKIWGADAKLFSFADAVEVSQRWLMLKRS